MWFYLFIAWYVIGFIVTWGIAVNRWSKEFDDRDFFDWFGTRFMAMLMATIWPVWAIGYIAYSLQDREVKQ